MKTFHEWLAERMAKNEGLWLNDKNAVIGMSRLNPLPKNSAVNKSLAKGPAKAKAMLPVVVPVLEYENRFSWGVRRLTMRGCVNTYSQIPRHQSRFVLFKLFIKPTEK